MKAINPGTSAAIQSAALSLRGGGAGGSSEPSGIVIADSTEAGVNYPSGVSTTLTLTPPATTEAGDLLLAIVFAGNSSIEAGNPYTATPAGWTYAGQYGTNKAPYQKPTAFWKVASASEPAASFVTSGSPGRHSGFLLRVTGADTADPIAETTGSYTTSYSATVDTGSITTTADNQMVIFAPVMVTGYNGNRMSPTATAVGLDFLGESVCSDGAGSGYGGAKFAGQLYVGIAPVTGTEVSLSLGFGGTGLGSNAVAAIRLAINPAT